MENAGTVLSRKKINTYILLTKREAAVGEYRPEVLSGRTERSEVHTKKDRGSIFSQYCTEQAWLVRDFLYD